MEIIDWIVVAVGHISFALTFLSFAQKSLIKLRIIAIISLLFGITYNSWVSHNMVDGNIWLVVLWLSIFLVQNVYLLYREIRNTLEVSLPTEGRQLLVQTFPKMHSADWVELCKHAKKRTHTDGEYLLRVGDATKSLSLLISGQCHELRGDETKVCEVGCMWGELTYVLGSGYFNKSPVDIISQGETQVWTWDYATLKRLSDKNIRLSEALLHGFVHSAGMKHGLLHEADGKSGKS